MVKQEKLKEAAEIDLTKIAHEIVHLKNYIYQDIGIESDRFNDEPEAYLTGWLFKQIEIFLTNKI
jgi:hypothetical protein